MMNMEIFGRKWPQNILKYAGIYLNGLRNTMRALVMEA
jgi:hypothetical protein